MTQENETENTQESNNENPNPNEQAQVPGYQAPATPNTSPHGHQQVYGSQAPQEQPLYGWQAPQGQQNFPHQVPQGQPQSFPGQVPQGQQQNFAGQIPQGQQQNFGQAYYGQQPPVGQTYAPPGYQGGYQQQSNYQPYPSNYYSGQPVYQEAQRKPKVWPWVLAICLIFVVLGLGGCVSCIAYTSLISDNSTRYDDGYYYDYGYNYDDSLTPHGYDDNTDPYDYDYDYSDPTLDPALYTYTLDEIKSLASEMPSTVIDEEYSAGCYEVGIGKDMEPGLYFLEGSQSIEGGFAVFEKQGSADEYLVQANVVYYGNYFAELAEGDVIVFFDPENAFMYPAEKADFEGSNTDTIASGCFRVGIDIPAGTYVVTAQNMPEDESQQEAGAYIMKDLQWNDDSIVASYFLMVGGSHEITVEEGQYVELYLGTMTAK